MRSRSTRPPVVRAANRDDPQPEDVGVTVATVLILLALLALMAVL